MFTFDLEAGQSLRLLVEVFAVLVCSFCIACLILLSILFFN